MAHGYRTLKNWDDWLASQFLGNSIIEQEGRLLSQLLQRHYGKHALLIGVPEQMALLASTPIPYHTLMSPLAHRGKYSANIEADFFELPILSGSIDLVLLPHTLEYSDNPRHLLAEACRIVKPEGLIVICGFNPYSMWGMKRFFSRHQSMPWAGNFIHAAKVKNWLRLADFELEQQHSALYRPPVNHQASYRQLEFIERVGKTCLPGLGGAYILLARAKVVPLTPIRLKWKQRLNGMRISTTISGHIARRTR